jgi:predicted short-subunit dehydrogenase-like oxidoreductase (DUF2520 family)
MRKISILGVGRLGGALAIALSKKGFEIENLVVRKKENARRILRFIKSNPEILTENDLSKISSDIVLIATQDSEIENAAKKLVESLRNKPFVFHTSGSLSSEILNDLREIGCRTGSLHPLVSVSDSVLGANRFENVYFCVEGDTAAVALAKEMVAGLGGKSFSVNTKYKALYHASAVTASGHLVALIDVAIEILTQAGLEKIQAQKILLPLIKSTIENLEEQTTAEALTGTFARADAETFERHLEILSENVSKEATGVYLQLGERSAHLAEERGAVEQEKLERLRKEISLAKKKFKC